VIIAQRKKWPTSLSLLLGEKSLTSVVTSKKVDGTLSTILSLGFADNNIIAPTFKLLGNSMILGALEIMAESLTLAEKTGIGAKAAYELMGGLSLKLLVSQPR
jgi:hypothetical protein